MEQEPDEKVPCYGEKVQPGWIFDYESSTYQSKEDTRIELEECRPIFKFKIWSEDFLKKLIDDYSNIYREVPWAQKFQKKEPTGLIPVLVEGTKSIVKRDEGIQPSSEHYIVKSVEYNYIISMLIYLTCQITNEQIKDLTNILYEMLSQNSYNILPTFVSKSLSVAYIFPHNLETKEITNSTHALKEFVRILSTSEVSSYPSFAKTMKPVKSQSYASAVKSLSSQSSIRESTQFSKLGTSVDQNIKPAYKKSDDIVESGKQVKQHTQSHSYNQQIKQTSNVKQLTKKYDEHLKASNKTETTLNKPSFPIDTVKSCSVKGKIDDESNLPKTHKGSYEQNYSNRSPFINVKHKNIAADEFSQKNLSDASVNCPLQTLDNVHTNTTFHKSKEIVKAQCINDERDEASTCKPFIFTGYNNEVNDHSLSVNNNNSDMGQNNKDVFERINAEDSKKINLLTVPLVPVEEDEFCGMTRKFYGMKSSVKGKTILLLGASGSGKTTLVNFIANYIRGNKKTDGELVHVATVCSSDTSQSSAGTSLITAYTFCEEPNNIPITIIDTPGLNDSSGAGVRDHINSLKIFLANFVSQGFEIHAIGYVAQAHLVRLTSSERLIMDYIISLFGKENEHHIITFITFSDNQENPPIVEAVTNYGVCCKLFLKFNNSALTNTEPGEIDELDRVYWRIGCRSLKKCLKALMELPALSVNTGTLKSLQDDVYFTQVVNIAEKKLKFQLDAFISLPKELWNLGEETFIKSSKTVWELCKALNHIKNYQSSVREPIEMTLIKYIKQYCEEADKYEANFIKLLSLDPSRSLMCAGIATLNSIVPLYIKAYTQIERMKRNNSNNNPYTLYCHACTEDHKVEVTQRKGVSIPFIGEKASILAFKCTKCECDGNLHGDEPTDSEDEMKNIKHSSITPHKLLQQTKNQVSDIVNKYSIQGYRVPDHEFLKYLNQATNCKYDYFINHLMSI